MITEKRCKVPVMGVKRISMTHPDWKAWMEASVYRPEQARRELGLANGTFYRRISKEPTHIDRLAMRALYEGLEPFTTKRIEG